MHPPHILTNTLRETSKDLTLDTVHAAAAREGNTSAACARAPLRRALIPTRSHPKRADTPLETPEHHRDAIQAAAWVSVAECVWHILSCIPMSATNVNGCVCDIPAWQDPQKR